MPLYVSSTCAHHQEVKIVLYSIWYHHTYRCDDTRCCIIQCWPPDDEHMCSKHIEAWNKLIVKQKFCSSSWLFTEINILRCTVSKTSKYFIGISRHYNKCLTFSITSQNCSFCNTKIRRNSFKTKKGIMLYMVNIHPVYSVKMCITRRMVWDMMMIRKIIEARW